MEPYTDGEDFYRCLREAEALGDSAVRAEYERILDGWDGNGPYLSGLRRALDMRIRDLYLADRVEEAAPYLFLRDGLFRFAGEKLGRADYHRFCEDADRSSFF